MIVSFQASHSQVLRDVSENPNSITSYYRSADPTILYHPWSHTMLTLNAKILVDVLKICVRGLVRV